MPRRARKTRLSPALLGGLLLSVLILFGLAELYRFTRSDDGRLALARILGVGQPNEVTRLVGARLRAAIAAVAGTDSIAERVVEERDPAMTWTVAIRRGSSLIQLNHALTPRLERSGVVVLGAREAWSEAGVPTLVLTAGLPGRATHEVRFVPRRVPSTSDPQREAVRLAVVVFGIGDDAAAADSLFRLEAPFAVALIPGARAAGGMFRAAHQRGREVVLHLPLEPINYPRIHPGPGTLLVTMKPSRIASDVRKFLALGEPLAAVSNHMGSLATQDMTVMGAVFRELRRARLPFVHVSPAAGAVCKPLAAELGVAYSEPDLVLEQGLRGPAAELDRRWKNVLRRARGRGRMVLWVRATPGTRDALARLLAPKKLDGVHLVPLTALIRPATAP